MLNNFIYAETKDLFLNELNAGNVLDEAIVFIADTGEIWNHGTYFAGDCGFDQNLFSEVQTAVAALQADKVNRNELSDYAKKTDLPNLSGYLTKDTADKTYSTIAQLNALNEKVGGVQTDLSNKLTASDLNGYAKTADIPTKTSQLTNNSGFISSTTADASYAPKTLVDTVSGNTTAISALQAVGAQKNVQSDWNATTGDAFIKNKPDLSVYLKSTDAANTYATQTAHSTLSTSVSNLQTEVGTKAAKATTLSGYGITDGVNNVSESGSGSFITGISIDGTDKHKLNITKGNVDLSNYATKKSVDDLTTAVNTHVNNSSVSKDGETLTVKINNTSQSLTNTWRPASDSVTSESSTNAASSKAVKAAYDEAVNAKTAATTAQSTADTAQTNITSHVAKTDNPHGVTKTQVGLGNVENTALSTWTGSNKLTTCANGTIIGSNNINDQSVKYAETAGSADSAKEASSAGTAGYADSAGSVLKSLTVGTKTFNGSAEVTITASDLGLSSALKYCGTTTTAIKNGDTTKTVVIDSKNHTAEPGCTVEYGDKLFTFTASNKWEELGNPGGYKPLQTAVSDPTASGNSTTFIDTISQDANGKITVTKKNVNFPAETSLSGGASAVSGKYVSGVTVDGHKVTVTQADLPSLSGGTSATADATVVGGVTVSGHAVTVNKKTIKGSGTVSVTGDANNITITGSAHPTALKNPNSISFKDTSNATKSYDGSSALDLTGGIYYAATAGSASTVTCQAGTTDVYRPIIVTNENNGLYYTSKAKLNYTTGVIDCGGVKMGDATMVYDSTEKCIKFSF